MTTPVERLSSSLADRYRVGRELGQGGMATVYLAEDLKHDRRVAIKVLHPELSAVIGGERFLAEIKTTASLQHPHILGLIDSGEADGLLYYVMPFIEGETLRARLIREKQLPIEDAVLLAREVASALEFAHKRGIVHRDIKPENILLQDGQALVADFGIALAVQQAGGSRMTETGMSLGTPAYMSPEQAMGERDLGPRSDVYALGAMTYEMLTGEPPFTGPNSQAIVAKVLTEPAPPIRPKRSMVPSGVEAAVLTALQKLPADRFGSAAQFAEALARPSAVAAPRDTVAFPTAARPAGRARFAAPWIVTALALVAAAWSWRARPAASPPSWQYIGLGDAPELMQTLPALALSPDGSTLAFTTATPPALLWIKRQRELAARPLPGTERAIYPAFSPDGDWIAFIADGRLRKVRVDGTSTLTLSDSSFATFGGAAWLDDGTLLFVGPRLTEFSRVSADGGRSSRVFADSALTGYGIGSPTALPGARGVLFVVCTSGCVSMALYALDLRSGKAHRLLDEAAGAWYLPTRQLLMVRRDGTALVAPFDLETLRISGEAMPVLEGVYTSLGVTHLAWSPNGTLVYRTGSALASQFDVMRVDHAGRATRIDESWRGAFNSLALAPDGKQLAMGQGLATGSLDIWLKELDRGPYTRLTFASRDRRPAWSPDGRELAFIRDTVAHSSVYARPADGSGGDRLLVRLDRALQEVEWSRDWIVVRTDNGGAGSGDIVGIRTRGDTVPVTFVGSPYEDKHPTISPDGRWLAFATNESGRNEVFVRPLDPAASSRWQVSIGGGDAPRWSPDGRTLYYLTGTHIMAATVRMSPSFQVGSRQPLFAVAPYYIDWYHQSYDVFPDGSGFLFLRPTADTTATSGPRLVRVERWFEELEARTSR
jgi:Tol biopolymer transport system component/tRNA A-37 threonylcarbamoyl transferase component Bud32